MGPYDDGDGQGRACARGERCASASRVQLGDGKWERTPALGPRALCDRDRDIARDCLEALPAAYGRLSRALGEHVTAEVLARAPFGPSVPLRTDVDEVMRQIADSLGAWHERVADVARLSSAPTAAWRRRALGPYAHRLVAASARVLAAHVDALIALEPAPMMRPAREGVVLASAGGGEAGAEFIDLEHRARSVLRETPAPAVRLLGVRCRNCSRMALALAPPAERDGDVQYYSACAWCRDVMTEAEYRGWTRAWAAYHRERLTPAQAAAAC